MEGGRTADLLPLGAVDLQGDLCAFILLENVRQVVDVVALMPRERVSQPPHNGPDEEPGQVRIPPEARTRRTIC